MGSVLTMEQAAILQHQLPLPSEYSLPSDHDCIDHYPTHSHHATYTNGGAVDHLRRDGTLPQPTLTFPSTNNPHGTRFVSDGGIASDGSSFRAGYNFTDSSSGSISTSPSSAASSLAHNTKYQQNHYTSLPTFSSVVQLPQAFAFGPGPRVPSIAEGTTPIPQPLHHIRSPITGTTNAGDREAHAYSTPFLAQPQPSSNGYASYTETPRSVTSLGPLALSPGALAYPHSAHMVQPSSQGYGASPSECSNFPWPNLEVVLEMTCEGQGVTPEIHAKVEKGFFLSTVDNKWTCYRRNYFSVHCSFELHPNISNGRMYLKRTTNATEREQVQAMGMRLSAAVDGQNGKAIDLVQHTPKRDNGPKSKIEVMKVSPMPSSGRNDHTVSPHGGYPVSMSTFTPTGTVSGPYLPLQHSSEPGSASSSSASSQIGSSYTNNYGNAIPIPGQSTSHTFERVQFKQATANNGKRRASQQYFHLVLELFADVRKSGSDQPVWVKVAQRGSDKIVVRGRSPSHYQNEGQHGQNGRSGGASGSGGYSTAGGAAYSSLNAGGFRSSTGGYGGSVSSSNGNRSDHHYSGYHHSSGDSASTPESVEGGAVDLDHPMDAAMTDADRAGIQEHDGYQYYPGPIYETIPPQLPLPKVEPAAHRYSTEPRQYAVKAEYADAVPGSQWQVGGFGRFQGVESSRGYFPDLSAGGGGYS